MRNILLSLLFAAALSLHAHEVVRAQCFGAELKMIRQLAPQLSSHGLLLVDEDPDILICTDVSEELLRGQCPIILCEKRGKSSLIYRNKVLLGHPNIIALFKVETLRDKTLYKKNFIKGSYHWALFADAAGLTYKRKSTSLSDRQIKKIHTMPFCGTSPFSVRYDALRNVEIDFDEERPIDLFFAGRLREIYKEGHLIIFSEHRKAAIRAMRNIKGIKSVIIEGVKPLPYDIYVKLMELSKIVVSPWGDSPWCFRDCEAMCLGAILVKPDTSFLLCYPDMFQNNTTYVPCSPNFFDLEQIIHRVLNNYGSYKPMRECAKHLMKSVTKEELAQEFASKVHKLLKEHRTPSHINENIDV